MTTSAPEPVKFSLSAHAEERFFAPLRNSSLNSRKGFFTAVAVVLFFHAAIIVALLYRDSQIPAPPPQETPVEVVMEQPKPPPEPQKQPQKQQQKEEDDERPAYSAPRVSKEPVNDPGTAEKTEGPKAATPPHDGNPHQTKQAEAPPPQEKPDVIEKKAALEDDKRDAEALDKTTPDPDKQPEKAQEKPLPKPPVPSTGETEADLAGRTDNFVPRFASAEALEDSPGGTESNRYIARIFGLILNKKHYAGSPSQRRGETGVVAVTFYVDFDGQIRREDVARSSGIASLDALAVNAIRLAGPFPPPPGAGGQLYVATISFP
jgi:TonB family protein